MIDLIAQNNPDIRIDLVDLTKSVVFPLPDRKPKPVNEEHDELLTQLRDKIGSVEARFGRKSFSVKVSDESTYRVQRIQDKVFSLRLCLNSCLSFEQLNIRPAHSEMLMAPELKDSGGLVLISGLPGSGKTATLAATISGRLGQFGGFAMSIEDVVEMPVSGFHGMEGFCEQVSIDPDETLYERIVDSLRCFPSGDTSMLCIGEIRENDAAAELLRIGIDGHLVMSTIHAKGPVEAIHRILTMAAQGGELSARSLLANSLRLIIHQKMINNKPHLTALHVNDKVRATILNGDINRLNEEVNATELKSRGIDGPRIR